MDAPFGSFGEFANKLTDIKDKCDSIASFTFQFDDGNHTISAPVILDSGEENNLINLFDKPVSFVGKLDENNEKITTLTLDASLEGAAFQFANSNKDISLNSLIIAGNSVLQSVIQADDLADSLSINNVSITNVDADALVLNNADATLENVEIKIVNGDGIRANVDSLSINGLTLDLVTGTALNINAGTVDLTKFPLMTLLFQEPPLKRLTELVWS